MLIPVYNLAIAVYGGAIRLASLWNPKARAWVRGRRQLFTQLHQRLSSETRPILWMHAASLGEFEQGRPLLEAVRERYPQTAIAVSFFSPSGLEVAKHDPIADHMFYLPLPTARSARKLLEILRPSLVFWVKYDYWYHYLMQLRRRNIPVLLISAVFHRRQPFFHWYGGLYRRLLQAFHHVFVQNEASREMLGRIGFRGGVTVAGDTRFDRVTTIADLFRPIPEVEAFVGNAPVIVAGSTWREDEEVLDHFANTRKDLRFIIAPHEIDEEHLQDIEKLFRHSVRFSRLDSAAAAYANTLIIDNIGMLARLYRYATVAYVGGGFGFDGVHNVLEAAVYGKPVVFGPEFNKYREAIDLLEEGAAFTVDTALEAEQCISRLLERDEEYRHSARAAADYVRRNRGATAAIIDYVEANRLLMS